MKVYYDISNTNITKMVPSCQDTTSKWTSLLLIVLAALQCFCIVHHSWYILHIDVESCLNCGPMIMSFGLLLENEAPEGLVQRLPVPVKNGVIDDVVYENNYTVEGTIHLFVGMWTTKLCLKDYKTCFNPWLAGTRTLFEQTPFIRDILESVYESRPFVLSALIATVITFLFTRFVQISSRSRAVAIAVLSSTISGILSILSFVIAGIPYMTSVNHAYIRVSPPWSLLATLVAGYVSFVIAYRVRMGNSGNRPILLRHWSTRQL